MNRLYLIDGYGGSPEINWLSNIEQKYKNRFDIQIIPYTNPTEANVVQWDLDLERGIEAPKDAYFICHSLGCITFLRYLQRHGIKIKGAILVSGFKNEIEAFPQFNPYFKGLKEVSWKDLIGDAYVISSKTDQIINWKFTYELADVLESPFILLPHGGHFSSGEGIVEMPVIEKLINSNWLGTC
ncbi:alpha/beta hydrolase [Lysinibacillus telephonicus]|uniref:Serine hydrolase family protein n=1 Tax=Lysinibacillus telephonicus TaxID=1714840 RepID=A0A3S0JI50_9BACI|nr:alpha/beta hydrolase [Lysinibacillus telephonicus]RTQ88614.1 serine hydrolase family protein [Lysinibacillus telephonicus]